VLLGRLKYVGAIGNRPIGRVRYVIDAIELSQYSEPLFDLKPGQVRSGESLSGVIVKLMEELRREMGEELRWSVKEVR